MYQQNTKTVQKKSIDFQFLDLDYKGIIKKNNKKNQQLQKKQQLFIKALAVYLVITFVALYNFSRCGTKKRWPHNPCQGCKI